MGDMAQLRWAIFDGWWIYRVPGDNCERWFMQVRP